MLYNIKILQARTLLIYEPNEINLSPDVNVYRINAVQFRTKSHGLFMKYPYAVQYIIRRGYPLVLHMFSCKLLALTLEFYFGDAESLSVSFKHGRHIIFVLECFLHTKLVHVPHFIVVVLFTHILQRPRFDVDG